MPSSEDYEAGSNCKESACFKKVISHNLSKMGAMERDIYEKNNLISKECGSRNLYMAAEQGISIAISLGYILSAALVLVVILDQIYRKFRRFWNRRNKSQSPKQSRQK